MVVCTQHWSHGHRRPRSHVFFSATLALLGLFRLVVCEATDTLQPLPIPSERQSELVDCTRICSGQLDRAAALFWRSEEETRESLEVKCHELRRLDRCLSSLSINMHFSGNPEPLHRNCQLEFSSLLHLHWVRVQLNRTCADVPEQIPDSMQTGSCRAERKPLDKRCERRNLTVCQLFGDRHLLRGERVLETCLLRGSWPMLQLPHFYVWATNVRKVPRCPSVGCFAKETTDLQMVQVAVRPLGKKKFVKFTVSAQDEFLPWSFDNDQRTVSMASDGDVNLWVSKDSLMAEISLPDLCTVVIIRLFNNHITVAALVPIETAFRYSPAQLCSKGCPPQEFVARYKWKAGVRAEKSAAPNVTIPYAADDICAELLANKSPIFLSACRWDVALRLGPDRRSLKKQFAYSSALAAQDQSCLLQLSQTRNTERTVEDGNVSTSKTIPLLLTGQTNSAITRRTSCHLVSLCACALWMLKALFAFED